MNLLAGLASYLLPKLGDAVDKVVPDKDLAAKLNAAFQQTLLNLDASELADAAGVVTAEAKGESWLQRNWRPITMMVFVAIVANNYLVAPYVGLFHPAWKLVLDTPPDLWDLIKIGLGGYIVGRSAEKFAANWKGNP